MNLNDLQMIKLIEPRGYSSKQQLLFFGYELLPTDQYFIHRIEQSILYSTYLNKYLFTHAVIYLMVSVV